MTEENDWTTQIDSKYRLVLIAARRSKQLQRGMQPKVRSTAKKFTRVALEEAQQGKLEYQPLIKPRNLDE